MRSSFSNRLQTAFISNSILYFFRSYPNAFVFAESFTNTVKVAIGLSSPSLPLMASSLFGSYTVCTFSGTYTTDWTFMFPFMFLSVFTVAIIYIFGALVHGKTCLMCTIFS